jgi:hypothetical protein
MLRSWSLKIWWDQNDLLSGRRPDEQAKQPQNTHMASHRPSFCLLDDLGIAIERQLYQACRKEKIVANSLNLIAFGKLSAIIQIVC